MLASGLGTLPEMQTPDRWDTDDILAESDRLALPVLEVRHGMTLTHTGSQTTGVVAGFAEHDRVVLRDHNGAKQIFTALDGAFTHEGTRVALRAPAGPAAPSRRFTASGSIAEPSARARVAKASRIWVEGMHDVTLIQQIWGEDLGSVGIVVEPRHGIDDLSTAVRSFGPGAGRRLGVLLDHLVEGSKEWWIAAGIDDPDVLICGHPYVDIWEAVSPHAAGISAWPTVPKHIPWKEGVLAALDITGSPGAFWADVRSRVRDYRDIETPLVNAVERLIDFVTEG